MRKYLLGLVLLFSTLISIGQEKVFLQNGEIGNGLIRERAGECIIITPNHVVSNAFGEISVTNKNKIKTEANFIQSYPLDLALLRLSDKVTLDCKYWEVSNFFNEALDKVSTGFVEYLDEFGYANVIHVNIIARTATDFIIIPQKSNISFVKGMSGSTFYIEYAGEKIVAGMLMSLEEDSEQAYVLQIDDILRTLSPFFDIQRDVHVDENAPKKIGVLLIKNDIMDSDMSKKLVASINIGALYSASYKFSKNDYIKDNLDDILSGTHDLVIPNSIQIELDQLLLGNITFEREINRKKMHSIHATFNGGVYETSNLNLVRAINSTGKGVGFDETSSENQALKSLLTNLKNQFK